MKPAPPMQAAIPSHTSTFQNRKPRAFTIRRENTTITSSNPSAPSTCTTLTKPLLRKNSLSYRVLSSTIWDAP